MCRQRTIGMRFIRQINNPKPLKGLRLGMWVQLMNIDLAVCDESNTGNLPTFKKLANLFNSVLIFNNFSIWDGRIL